MRSDLVEVSKLEKEGDGNENVPLYYYITDNIIIQREEFCLVTGLRFWVEKLADYDDVELRIPFRRRVFSPYLDGEHSRGNMVFKIIDDKLFDTLHDDDVVSLCCLGILQLVLLGVEGKRQISEWMLRLANDRGNLSAARLTPDETDRTVIKAQKNQNPEAGQMSMARDGSVFRYDPDYLREQFAGLVTQRALPFNHFNHEQTTREFQNTMQPRYTHVSRSILKRDAMRLWLAAKQEIIDSFGNLNACVNLTTNVWSAPHEVPGSYMCITVHWIKPGTWQMMKRVILFEKFLSPHTGHALFKMLIKVLTNFNLEDKLISITLDNASNNTSAIEKLKLKYDPPIEGFWKEKETMFPVLSRMAIDLISVQASSVAFESAFSTSGRVLSIRRTRLTPASLEMCMCLKDHLDAKERKQDKCTLEIPLDFEEDDFDDKVQRNEAIPLSNEEFTLDASSEGTLSPR
nr:transposase [Tanacetum cinerariifolium]